jgi:hypothetical protein
MKYGGERSDAMASPINSKVFVPQSIKLLFENEKLDLMKTLTLLYAFVLHSKRKKKRKVSEVVFYYSLVNFDLIRLFVDQADKSKISPNLYFRFQIKINRILLKLSHLDFIEIKGTLNEKIDDLLIELTPKGVMFFKELNLPILLKLTEKYINALNRVNCTAANIKILKGD